MYIHVEMLHGHLDVLDGGSGERSGLQAHISEETDNENDILKEQPVTQEENKGRAVTRKPSPDL